MQRVHLVFVALSALTLTVSAPAWADGAPAADHRTTHTAPTSDQAGRPILGAANRLGSQGNIKGEGSAGAGTARGVNVSAAAEANGKKTTRPEPTPRVRQRMNAARALAGVDGDVKACAAANTSPAALSFSVRMSVSEKGEPESVEPSEDGHGVTPAVLSCVSDALMKVKFGSPGPAGATVAVPVIVPAKAPTAKTAASNASNAKTAPTAPRS